MDATTVAKEKLIGLLGWIGPPAVPTSRAAWLPVSALTPLPQLPLPAWLVPD